MNRSRALIRRVFAILVICVFGLDSLTVQAGVLGLPSAAPFSGAVGANLPFVQGLSALPQTPLEMDFLLSEHSSFKDNERLERFIRYFLAALTIPSDKLWVNLSPSEPDRIMDEQTASTDLGRGLLEQDFILKRMAAALTHPDTELGRKYWEHIYTRAYRDFGTTDIPLEGAQKVWIVPGDIELHQEGRTVVIGRSRLKVLTEDQYLKDEGSDSAQTDAFKENILPVLEREVNECDEFQTVRDIFQAAILAVWYKNYLKSAIWNAYVDQNKVAGIDTNDPAQRDRIFQEYLGIFQDGLYDLIREDYNPATQSMTPRRYFSGGLRVVPSLDQMNVVSGLNTASMFSAARVAFQPVDVAMLNIRSLRTWIALAAFAGVMMLSSVQGFAQSAGTGNPDGPWLQSYQGRDGIVLSRDYGRVDRPEQTHVYSAFKANPKVFELIKVNVSKDDVKSAIDGTKYDAFQKKQLKSFVDQNYSKAFGSGHYSIMDEWMVFAAQGELGLVQDGDLGPVTEKTIFAKWASTGMDIKTPVFQQESGGPGSGGGGDSLVVTNNSVSPGISFDLSDDNESFALDTTNLASEPFMPVVHLHSDALPDSTGSALQDTTSKPLFFGFQNFHHQGGGSSPPPPVKENIWNWLQYEWNIQAGSQTDSSNLVYDFEGSLQLNAGKFFKWNDSLQLMLGSRFFAHKFPEEVDLHHRIEEFEHQNEEEHEGEEEEHEGEEDGHEGHKGKLVEVNPFVGLNIEMPGDIETGFQVMPFGERRWLGGHISQSYFWGSKNRRSSASWNFQPWLSWGHEKMSVFKLDLTARLAFSDRLTLTPAVPIVFSDRVNAGFNARVDWKLAKNKSNNIFLAYSLPINFHNPLFEELFEPVFHQHPTALIVGLATPKITFDVQWRNPGQPYQQVTVGAFVPLRAVKEKPRVSDLYDVVIVSHGNHVHQKYVLKGPSAEAADDRHLPKDLRILAKHPDLGKFSLGLPIQKKIGDKEYWAVEYHNDHWSFILLGHLKDYLAKFPEHHHEETDDGHEEEMEPLPHVIEEIMEKSPEYFELPDTYDENMYVPVPENLQSLDLKPYFNGQEGFFQTIKDDVGWKVLYMMRLGVSFTRYTPQELLEHIRGKAANDPITAVLETFSPDGYLFKRPVSGPGAPSIPATTSSSDKAQLADYGGIDLTGIEKHVDTSGMGVASFRGSLDKLNPFLFKGMAFRIIRWTPSISLGEILRDRALAV